MFGNNLILNLKLKNIRKNFKLWDKLLQLWKNYTYQILHIKLDWLTNASEIGYQDSLKTCYRTCNLTLTSRCQIKYFEDHHMTKIKRQKSKKPKI